MAEIRTKSRIQRCVKLKCGFVNEDVRVAIVSKLLERERQMMNTMKSTYRNNCAVLRLTNRRLRKLTNSAMVGPRRCAWGDRGGQNRRRVIPIEQPEFGDDVFFRVEILKNGPLPGIELQ